jgi:signal transduction histidine kinase
LLRVGLGALLAVVVLAGTLLATIPQAHGPHPIRLLDVWGVLLVVSATVLTTVLLRPAPVLALVAAVLLVNAYLLRHYPFGAVQLCLVVAMYEVARRRRLPLSLLVCGAAAAVSSAAIYLRLTRVAETPFLLALAWAGWLIVPWLLGALMQTVAAGRERGRRHLIAQGAMAERVKLAAEVHDVAGHGFALVAMQAGVALLDFDSKPDQTRRSLEAIQTTSTKSLAALRGMLDTFHDGQSPAVAGDEPVRPATAGDQDGLCDLVELVDEVRAGGLPVRLDVRNLVRTLDPQIDAAAYRVVQESLTNVLRHAGRTTAEVSIEQDGDCLLVAVRDSGRGAVGPDAAGRGLAGMRRRVEALGGSLVAGPRDDGGFRVEARLPTAKGFR